MKEYGVEDRDLILVKKCLDGDKKAFEELVNRYSESVYNLSYRMISDREEANDIAQETFIRVYCSLKDFRGGKFSTWIFRIANNLCIDYLRRRRLAPISLESLRGGDKSSSRTGSSYYDGAPQNVTARSTSPTKAIEQRMWIEDAIANLPLKYRRAIVLRYVEDLSYEEIGDVLGLPLNTVKTHIRRGRKMLREILSRDRDA